MQHRDRIGVPLHPGKFVIGQQFEDFLFIQAGIADILIYLGHIKFLSLSSGTIQRSMAMPAGNYLASERITPYGLVVTPAEYILPIRRLLHTQKAV